MFSVSLYLSDIWISFENITVFISLLPGIYLVSIPISFNKVLSLSTLLKAPIPTPPPHTNSTLQQVIYFWTTTSQLLYSLLWKSGSISFELFLIVSLSYL